MIIPHLKHHVLLIKKETANIFEYKVDTDANIANFVRLWKTQMQYNSAFVFPSKCASHIYLYWFIWFE